MGIDDLAVTFLSSAPPTGPTLTGTPATLTGFAYVQGAGPSASQSFDLSGTSLTGAPGTITVTGSASYEVSADNTTFGPTATVAYTGASLAATPIYVRLKTGLTVNSYPNELITAAGGGAASMTVATVSGSVTAPAAATITTGTVSPTPVCATTATDVTVNYTTANGPTGTFTAQLSSATGSFTTPLTLTTVSATATSLTVTIPAGTASGTGYKIQVVSSDGTTGSASAAFTIVNNPTVTIAPIATQNITAGANGPTLTATETPSTGNTRVWQVSTTSATTGFANISPAQAGPTYIPNFSAAGTYYVRVLSTFAACGDVASNAVQVNVTAVPTPTLTVTPAVLTGFSTTVGTPSASQSFLLTGSNLTGSVTVTPPSGYELSLSSNSGYRSSLTSLAVNSTGRTIYVRLTGAAVGTYGTPTTPVLVVSTATGATPQNVAVDGEVTPLIPAIVANPTTLSGFTATVGTASAFQSYVLTPTALSAPITVTAPAGFEVSLTAGSGYAATVSASQTNTTTIYVRLAAAAALGVYNGVVTNVSGPVSQDVAVSGSVSPAPVAGGPGLLVLEEDFDYPAGTILSSTANWNQLTGGASNSITVTGSSLSFDQYGSPARIGASVTIKDGQDVARGFAVVAGTTDFYASVLANVTTAPSFDDYFFALMPTATASNFAARVYTKSSGSGVQFGIAFSGPAAIYGPTIYALGTPVTLVVRYIKNPGASDDVLELYAFAVSDGIPFTKPSTPLASVNAFSGTTEYIPGAVAIRQGNGTQSITLDGIRVGTGWGAVVGRPVYTAASSIINAGYYYDAQVNNASTLTPAGAVSLENGLTLTSGLINTDATNSLTLYAGATVSGGGPTSYVNGPVLRQTLPGAASSVFPVGKGGAYRPITLTATAQGAASTYTAEQFNAGGGPSLDGSNGLGTAPLNRVSSKHYYTVASSNTTAGNFTGTITLSFGNEAGQEDYVNTPNDPDFVIAKRDNGGSWTNLGRSTNTGSGAGAGGPSVAGTLTSAVFSNFSDFALGAQNVNPTNPLALTNPLPVELTSFTARRTAAGAVALAWTTASERNSAHFEVERSADGKAFARVGQVEARGYSARPTAYAYPDAAAPAGPLYYRLRQLDRDGAARYSPVVAVAAGGQPEAAALLLYPNPTADVLHLRLPAAAPYRVLNQLGQPLLTGTLAAGATTLDVRALRPGLYHLEVRTEAGRVVRKFVRE